MTMITQSTNISWMSTIQRAKDCARARAWDPLITLYSFFSCFENSWKFIQQPHHSLLTHLENILPPSKQNLSSHIETVKTRDTLFQLPLCVEHQHVAQPWPLGTKGKFAKTRVRRGQTEEEDTVLFFDQKTSEKSYPFSAFFLKKKCICTVV